MSGLCNVLQGPHMINPDVLPLVPSECEPGLVQVQVQGEHRRLDDAFRLVLLANDGSVPRGRGAARVP